MKILHVTPYFHGAWAYGGIPRLSYHLAAAQAALGHEVHAVTTDVHDRSARWPPGDYEPGGVKVRVYKNLSNRAAYDLQFFFPLGLNRERRSISSYDVIHVHGHRNLLNTRMAALAYAAGIPTVLMPNGTLVNIERRQALKTIYDKLWGNRQVARAAAFVAVSWAEEKQFRSLGIAPEKIRVIPNGVEPDTDDKGADFPAAFGIKGDYILYLGKITPRKGVEHAAAALALLDDKNILLAIAGNDMGYLAEVMISAREAGVADRVICTGLVTGAMKASAYKHALYTIYTGRDEIFGLVPWESLVNGTPVIVADDCGCGEWIAKAGAGHVVPYADPAAIARVVNARDDERDRAMVEAGAAFARERLAWMRIAREMIQYYQEIIGDH